MTSTVSVTLSVVYRWRTQTPEIQTSECVYLGQTLSEGQLVLRKIDFSLYRPIFSGFLGGFFQECLNFYILRARCLVVHYNTLQKHSLTIFRYLTKPISVTLKVAHLYQKDREKIG